MSASIADSHLIALASEAREAAHAPYSAFRVGAALLSEDGQTFTGCNIENISFGLTMCAERVAIGSAIRAGAHSFVTVAVVSDSTEPVVPCGACRQVLAEFSPGMRVISATSAGARADYTLDELFPRPKQGILG